MEPDAVDEGVLGGDEDDPATAGGKSVGGQ
jgi:hypothetical protein